MGICSFTVAASAFWQLETKCTTGLDSWWEHRTEEGGASIQGTCYRPRKQAQEGRLGQLSKFSD